MSTVSKILVYTSPPGGVIDPNGPLAVSNTMTLSTTSKTATSTTSPFASPVSSTVEFILAGPIVTMSWAAIPAATTSSGGFTTWTYNGFVPSAYRPLSTQVGIILAQNDSGVSTATDGSCQVDTSGNVTFTAGTGSTPGSTTTWGRTGGTSSIFGFTMAWKNQSL